MFFKVPGGSMWPLRRFVRFFLANETGLCIEKKRADHWTCPIRFCRSFFLSPDCCRADLVFWCWHFTPKPMPDCWHATSQLALKFNGNGQMYRISGDSSDLVLVNEGNQSEWNWRPGFMGKPTSKQHEGVVLWQRVHLHREMQKAFWSNERRKNGWIPREGSDTSDAWYNIQVWICGLQHQWSQKQAAAFVRSHSFHQKSMVPLVLSLLCLSWFLWYRRRRLDEGPIGTKLATFLWWNARVG